MNLEEKSEEYAGSIDCNIYVKGGRYVGYKAGYKQSIADVTEFIRVNPKATHQAIIEYLEGVCR